MQTLFMAGKGGTGKSTLTAALGYQLSEKGCKCLITSLDPAHNICDIFKKHADNRITRYNSGLSLYEPDIDAFSDSYVKRNTDLLKQLNNRLKTLNLDYYLKSFESSPSKEDYGSVLVLEYLFRECSGYDYILLDTPPTGLFMRILSSLKMNAAWIDMLIKLREKILEKRHTIHNINGKYSKNGTLLKYKKEDDPVYKKLADIYNSQNMVWQHILSPDSRIAAVLNPDTLSLKETKRMLKALKSIKLDISAYLLNKNDGTVSDDTSEFISGRYCVNIGYMDSDNDFMHIKQDITGVIL